MFDRRIFRLPNYISRFGLIQGIRLLFLIERAGRHRSTSVKSIDLPGYTNPIHFRDTRADRAIIWQCIVDAQYDVSRFPQAHRLHSAYSEKVRQGERPLIIDCGGNIGLSALWLARAFPEARVVAIEPEAENYRMLELNIRPFGDRVSGLQGGVWHENGYLQITNPEAGSTAFQVSRLDHPTPGAIRAYTIPEICKLMNCETPFIVKLDVEGSQKAIFSANTDWVGHTDLIMLELDDWLMPWSGSSRSFFSTVSRYPFDYLIRGETIFCFRDTHPDRQDI